MLKERSCPTCDIIFTPPKKYKHQKYCSKECFFKRKTHLYEEMKERVCPTCDDVFIPPLRNIYKKYCSQECYQKRGTKVFMESKLNTTENLFKNSFKENVTQIFHSGFPDFLIEKNDEIIFVEVKSETDGMHPKQIKVMDVLTKHGIPCFISLNGSNNLIPFEKIRPHLDLGFTRQRISTIISRLSLEKNQSL